MGYTQKSIKSKNSINQTRYPYHFREYSVLKRIFTIVAWEINNAKSYLYNIIDEYKFFASKTSFSRKNRNFPDYYENTNGASDIALDRLAKSVGIDKTNYGDILLAWESNFISKTTRPGIQDLIKLYFKNVLLNKGFTFTQSDEIISNLNIVIYTWYDSEIADEDTVYFYNDLSVLDLYLEINIPSSYAKYFINTSQKINELLNLLQDSVIPTANIKYIQIHWS